MKKLLIIGAGRSSTCLIDYLKAHFLQQADLQLTLADSDISLAKAKIGNDSTGRLKAIGLDIFNEDVRNKAIAEADVVVSMLPARMHGLALDACLAHKKPLLTASYVSDEFREREAEIKDAGIPVVMECGLDPGIDHMTAMEAIDRIREQGGKILGFRSYTGGLVAPESDNNPWHYKFSWNPRNVVLAGQGSAARYIRYGKLKYIPYHRLFRRVDPIHVKGYGDFEGYANRDSLSYRAIYGLENIPTILRGTLRKEGYCAAWDALIQLGLTDDSFQMEGIGKQTKRDYINAFLPYQEGVSVEEKLCVYLGIPQGGPVFDRLAWLGLFTDEPLELEKENASPAQVLQHILEEKWKLGPQDKDMIVMQHLIDYQIGEEYYQLQSSLVALGEDAERTAMAKTVGWPLGIAVKLLMQGKITEPGIHVPAKEHLYAPILAELKTLGIGMEEEIIQTDMQPTR